MLALLILTLLILTLLYHSFVEPVPHHAAVWRVRNPDESGRGFRFFRLMQIRSRKYKQRSLIVQGFEIYGALRMGLAEEEAESVVNPSGLTEEEEELLEGQVLTHTHTHSLSLSLSLSLSHTHTHMYYLYICVCVCVCLCGCVCLCVCVYVCVCALQKNVISETLH
jgi:hypothetical protein